jgi:hypothetical protein
MLWNEDWGKRISRKPKSPEAPSYEDTNFPLKQIEAVKLECNADWLDHNVIRTIARASDAQVN